jgi:hypothetical protein
MSKKLVSLVLVLAIAGMASAGTAVWNNAVQVGNWEVASNWTQNGTSPVGLPPGQGAYTNDFAAAYPQAGGYTAVTINLSSLASVGRMKYQFQTTTLNINSGGNLLNNGSIGGIQLYGNTSDITNVNSGGKLIATGSTYGLVTGNGSHTININSGGLMGAYGNASHLATNALNIGGTNTGGGSTTVNVYGILDADSINMANANHVVKLYTGGVIYVWGTLGGTIVSGDGGTIGSAVVTDPVAGSPLNGLSVTKYYIVPEPATLALLGLGSLTLLRRKR